MKYINRFFLTTAVVLSSQSFLYQETLFAGKISIPSTLSQESQGTLKFFDSFIEENNKKLFDGVPAPDDLSGWEQFVQEREKGMISFNAAVVEKFRPTFQAENIGDTPILDIKPRAWVDNGKVVVYLHGGGFTTNTAENQKIGCVPLADKSGLRVISVDYTRAPFAKHDKILDQVVSVFKGLKESGYRMEDIVTYGDSSGANLATAATLKMRDEGIGLPAAIVLWSPWLDLTGSGDTFKTMEEQDPILSADTLRKCALAYAPLEEHTNSLVSPLFGDFTKGFPPTLIQFGTKEMLASDSTRLYTKLVKAGQIAELYVQEGMWHGSHAFSEELPESQEALQMTADFMKKHLFTNGMKNRDLEEEKH
jgi:monoterpene epsilon-lactone hydrolase